jgi:hypothetical protein
VADTNSDLKVIHWLVTLRAKRLGYRYEDVAPDEVVLIGPDGQRHELPLDSLRRAATALPRAEWQAAVHEFVDGWLSPEYPADETLESVRPLLRTKMVREETARERSAVYEEFGQELVEVLVLDRALTMDWVTEERVARWSGDPDELLEQGRENVHTAGRLTAETVEMDEVPVTMLSGDDYASTHLRWLDEYGLVGEHGTLVSMPTRTAVLATPITAGTTGFHYLGAMVRLTASMYGDAEHPLMPRLYHWDPEVMDATGQMLGAALLQPANDHRLMVIVNPAFQESQEALSG